MLSPSVGAQATRMLTTQVYISTPATNRSDAIDRLTTCITQIRDLMASSRLKLNEEKTQII